MYKIAVVGDRQSVSGFASLGLSAFEVTEPKMAEELIKKLSSNGFGIIYVTEKIAAEIPETIEKYRSVPIPAVILIPGVDGNTSEGIAAIHKSVEKAVGSDILSK